MALVPAFVRERKGLAFRPARERGQGVPALVLGFVHERKELPGAGSWLVRERWAERGAEKGSHRQMRER